MKQLYYGNQKSNHPPPKKRNHKPTTINHFPLSTTATNSRLQSLPVFLEALLVSVISCFPLGMLKIRKTNSGLEEAEEEEEREGAKAPGQDRAPRCSAGG